MTKNKPIVSHGFLKLPDAVLDSPVDVGSAGWFYWLGDSGSTQFGVETSSGSFTCKLETRSGSDYWYGYKRKFKKLRKLYVGKTEDLTDDRLNEACFEINTSDRYFWNERSPNSQLEKLPKELPKDSEAPGAVLDLRGLKVYKVRDLLTVSLADLQARFPEVLVSEDRLPKSKKSG